MKLLITAGNTTTPVDPARVLASASQDRHLARVVATAWQRGHELVVLTSTSEPLSEIPTENQNRLHALGFRTHDDLLDLFPRCLASFQPDAILHCAEVGEYAVAGLFRPHGDTLFAPRNGVWQNPAGPPAMIPATGGEPEQWIRLVRAPRIIERTRSQWGFTGVLILGRIEPEMSDLDLVRSAEAARQATQADLVLTSTRDGEHQWAFLGPLAGKYDRLIRREIPDRLIAQIEEHHRKRVHHG